MTTPSTASVSSSRGTLTIGLHPFSVTVTDSTGRSVLRSVADQPVSPSPIPPATSPGVLGNGLAAGQVLYAPLVAVLGVDQTIAYPGGQFVGNQVAGIQGGLAVSSQDVVATAPIADGLHLTVATDAPSGLQLTVDITAPPGGALRMVASAPAGSGVATMAFSFASSADEAFHGFGGRHNAIDEHGIEVDNWVDQEAIGSGPLAPVQAPLPGSGGQTYLFPNGPTAAYSVQPAFVSSRGYGFLLTQTDVSRFRLDSDRPDAWEVAAGANHVDAAVAPGDLGAAVAALTEITGRQPTPPSWALGVLFDREVRVFGNETQVTYLAEVQDDIGNFDKYHLPVSGYRIEGWPLLTADQLHSVIAQLRSRGIHALLYFRAFASDDGAGTEPSGVYSEATSNGYVATTAAGSPYLFEGNFPGRPAALIDFSNARAVTWWQGRITAALDAGADGFMEDFGEQVLPDMHFADGEDGTTMHNRYPILYHRATAQALAAYRLSHPARELWDFVRSSYSGAAGYEGASFLGDGTTDFSASSGLASTTPDELNRGIGGEFGPTSDIGGYFDVTTGQTTNELFDRWAEQAALTPFFRLHGGAFNGVHTPWSYNQATVDLYLRLADLHRRAAPLMARLWAEGETTGQPPMRPLWLAAPGDPVAAQQAQEWEVGPDLLVAPVVTQGASARSVTFPAGCWVAPDTGVTYHGPSTSTVAAPLDRLPYFVRCGTEPLGPLPSSGAPAAPLPSTAGSAAPAGGVAAVLVLLYAVRSITALGRTFEGGWRGGPIHPGRGTSARRPLRSSTRLRPRSW